jgi:hypothetical protein
MLVTKHFLTSSLAVQPKRYCKGDSTLFEDEERVVNRTAGEAA